MLALDGKGHAPVTRGMRGNEEQRPADASGVGVDVQLPLSNAPIDGDLGGGRGRSGKSGGEEEERL